MIKRSMQVSFTIITTLVLHGCAGTSTIGGNGSSGAINSASILILGQHYQAHQTKLTNIFQLQENAEAFNILDEYREVFETQTLNSTYMNSIIKVYAKACEEVSVDAIAEGTSFEDVYFMMTGQSPGADEAQAARDIQALFNGESQDYQDYGNCFVAATSLFSISQLSSLSLQ